MPADMGVLRGSSQGGYLSRSVAGAVDVTLSPDDAENETIVFTGAITANINVILPCSADSGFKSWKFQNSTSGAFTLTVKGALGSGLAITATKKVIAVWTGADFVAWAAEY